MARELTGKLLAFAGSVVLGSFSLPAFSATQAGEVVIARGITTAHQPSAVARIIGSGSAINKEIPFPRGHGVWPY